MRSPVTSNHENASTINHQTHKKSDRISLTAHRFAHSHNIYRDAYKNGEERCTIEVTIWTVLFENQAVRNIGNSVFFNEMDN